MKDPLEWIGKGLRDKFGNLAPSPSSLSEKEVKRSISQTIEVGIDELLPIAAKEIGISKNELGKRLNGRRFIFNADFNGSTSSSDGWATFDIRINLGLIQFYFHMVKIFATRIGVMETAENAAEGSQITFDRTVQGTKDLMRAFFDGKILSHEGLPIIDLSKNQLIIADKILREINIFVLAHEFGHIVIHAKRVGADELEAATDIVNQVLVDTFQLPEGEMTRVKESWSEEIAADFIGVKLSLARHNNDMDRILAYSSSELFFIILNMLETFYARSYGQPTLVGTHPPSKIRLEILRLAAKDNNPSAYQMGQAFEQVANLILERK